MSENYSVFDTQVCLEFQNKDPEEVSDYLVDFAPLLPEGAQLSGTPTVTIEAAGNGESPTLEAQDVSLASGEPPVGSPPLETAVLFWLSGGTDQVRYRGKIKVQLPSTGSPAPARTLVKRFYIVASGFGMTGSPEQGEAALAGSPEQFEDPSDQFEDAVDRV